MDACASLVALHGLARVPHSDGFPCVICLFHSICINVDCFCYITIMCCALYGRWCAGVTVIDAKIEFHIKNEYMRCSDHTIELLIARTRDLCLFMQRQQTTHFSEDKGEGEGDGNGKWNFHELPPRQLMLSHHPFAHFRNSLLHSFEMGNALWLVISDYTARHPRRISSRTEKTLWSPPTLFSVNTHPLTDTLPTEKMIIEWNEREATKSRFD